MNGLSFLPSRHAPRRRLVASVDREARAQSLRRSPYPPFVGRALRAWPLMAAWDRALLDVRGAQERQLRELVAHAAETEFGRTHDFARIRSHADFAKRAPIGDYDSFAPQLNRMRSGDANLLVPEYVLHFGHSSGSSNQGRPKFLPITERQIRHQQRAGADVVMRYLAASGHDAMFGGGFTLGLFPPITPRRDGHVFVSSNPALMMTRMPAIARPCYLPEDDVRRMADYDEKLTLIAERYFDWDVHAVTGTTCWFTLLFEKVMAEARRRGFPARCVADVWPNLRVLFGGGVSAAPYVPVIRDWVGRDDISLVDTYNATEGGIYAASDCFRGSASGMLMLPHRGTFFEFVALDEWGKRNTPAARRVPLWEVERDRPYVLVVTTVSGLYAYALGDIVRFTESRPPRIEFVGRLSGCLSLTQELTTHVEIERAVEHATAVAPCRTVDFGAAADVAALGTAKSRYLLFVEFQEGAAPADLAAFEAAFDQGLCAQNRVYREHRAGDVALLPALVVPVRRGGARAFLEEVTRGNVQGKFPRVLDEAKKQVLSRYVKPCR